MLFPSDGLQRVPIWFQSKLIWMPSHIWRLFTGNSDSRLGNSLDSVIVAFIGLFSICLCRHCWFFVIHNKCHSICILYFNVSPWRRGIECSLAAARLAVKSASRYFSNGDPFSHPIGVKCTGMKIRNWNFSFLSLRLIISSIQSIISTLCWKKLLGH